MGRVNFGGCEGLEEQQPLLSESSEHGGDAGQTSAACSSSKGAEAGTQLPLGLRVWTETKKLWYILGPSIFNRVAGYTMNLITQACAGHLGEVELAAMSISVTVIAGFNFGLLLGMASALETLCGQAYGAKRYRMLGIYVQRSFIVLVVCCVLLLPIYVFAAPLLRLLGQSDDVSELTGELALWLIPFQFSLAFVLPLNRFFQSQLKAPVIAWISLVGLAVNVASCWLCIYVLGYGVLGLAVCLDLSWWIIVFGLLGYATLGGCPSTWTGWSPEAFSGLWEFAKLSIASGVMLCLENWYYRILILMTGYLHDVTIALDALSVCLNISGWELMIPFAFLAATGVRVANELGGGNAKAAQFSMVVSVVQSAIIGLFFSAVIIILRSEIGYIFTSSPDVLEEVSKLSYLLGAAVLLNSVQPVLSGVAVGSGWQAYVAYINLGCYYLIGLPLGFLMGWVFHLGVMVLAFSSLSALPTSLKQENQEEDKRNIKLIRFLRLQGIWGGMILGGTAVQTVILAIVVTRCDWDKEAEKAQLRVAKWSSPSSDDGESVS